jgi:DNA invertase Pin-like site-specific DNA recombinase
MANGRFVAYYRVSTAKQGISGLGLEAQQAAVRGYLNGGDWKLVDSRTEVESGKRSDNRPELAEALRLCRVHNATLIVAKLDRLSRNVAFISTLMESGVKLVAVDMPFVNEMVLHILAAVAQGEAKMCSDRTKAGLEAAKARGRVLGSPNKDIAMHSAEGHAASLEARQQTVEKRIADMMPIIEDIQGSGITTLAGIAKELNKREIYTPREHGKKLPTLKPWSAVQVSRVLARI